MPQLDQPSWSKDSVAHGGPPFRWLLVGALQVRRRTPAPCKQEVFDSESCASFRRLLFGPPRLRRTPSAAFLRFPRPPLLLHIRGRPDAARELFRFLQARYDNR